MKRNHLLAVAGMLLLAACTKKMEDVNTETGTAAGLAVKGGTPEGGADGGSLTGGCTSKWNYEAYQFTGMSAGVARRLAFDYQQINQPKLLINGSIPDSKTMWLSLETLKAYIWKIEQAVCSKACPSPLNLGVRIYFGRYPTAGVMASTPDLADLPSSYEQHHTAFLVPTYQDRMNPSVQWDFDPWHWGNNNCMPTSFRTWFGNEGGNPFGTQKSLIMSISEKQLFPGSTFASAGNLIQNHGGLIPPDPEEGTGF